MKVRFLGTGTSQGVPVIGCPCQVCQSTDARDKRLRSAILIEDKGLNYVIDTGPDFRQQMLSAQVKDVEAILFTHEHIDHIVGLDDVRPFNFLHQKDMPVYATERVQTALKRVFQYIFTPPFYPGIPKLKLHTISKEEPFIIKGLQFIPIEVMHHKLPVLGFRVGDFTYITDAKTIAPEEKEKIKGTKILVVNALRKSEHISHMNVEEALALVEEIKPEKAYFSHCSHLLGFHEAINKELPTGVELAYDGLELEVG